MKKANRITSNEDFAKIIHSNKPYRSECFLVFSKIQNLNYGRVGISVSKKVGNAVVRNKIKRQLRAMCDQLIDYSKVSRDYVIVVKDGYLKHDFKENMSTLEEFLKQLGKR